MRRRSWRTRRWVARVWGFWTDVFTILEDLGAEEDLADAHVRGWSQPFSEPLLESFWDAQP
jgi:hypothetical protein